MEKTVIVGTKDGIDADMVSVLVQTACKFESSIYLKEAERRVNMKSIMGMMNMVVAPGKPVDVIAEGEDAQEAIAEIEGILSGR